MFWFKCLKLFLISLAVNWISENLSPESFLVRNCTFVTHVSCDVITLSTRNVPTWGYSLYAGLCQVYQCFLWFECGVVVSIRTVVPNV